MRRVALALILLAGVARADAPRGGEIDRIVHRDAGDAPSIGPSDALVTVELFFIPGAVQSRAPYKALVELQARHPRRIRLVLRPLSRQGMILVPEALMEAQAEGKFFELLDAVSAAGHAIARQDLLALCAQVGVDPARVAAAWDDERHKPALDANEARRQRHYALGVPDALFDGVPVSRPLPSLAQADLENAYQDAYDRAQALLADGVPRQALPRALERTLDRPETVFVAGVVDDAAGDPPPDQPPLLVRALDLAGLPSSGPAGAPVPIVILCDITLKSCNAQIKNATLAAALFPGQVRVVWSPWYAPGAVDTIDADRVARAALCAEEQGAGWDFVDKALERTARDAAWSAEGAIHDVADDAGADVARLERCLAQRPVERAEQRIRDALARGVRHGPAVVVGGRVYMGGISEPRILQGLVEDELEPGLLGRAAPDWQTE